MNMTHARLAVYVLGALVGAFLIGLGAIRGDWALITAGGGLLGTGALAGANTHPEDSRPRGAHAAE